MAFKKFKTDRRLWFWVSLVLFVIPWLLPIIVFKGEVVQPAVFWVRLFHDTSNLDLSGAAYLMCIFHFTLFFGVPAIAIGWIIQFIIVRIRQAKIDKPPDA